MRLLVAVVVMLVGTGPLAADTPGQRHGIDPDLKMYKQGSPKETLASVLQAIQNKRVDYLLAHLAEPEFVDRRVQINGGDFEALVNETRAKVVNDPGIAKLLRRFLDEGSWEEGKMTAKVKLKEQPDRRVLFVKVGDRWFMKNDYREPPQAQEE